VTVLVSSDKPDAQAKTDTKSGEVKTAVSKRAKRGGAAAAPRAKRAAPKSETPAAEDKPRKKASQTGSKLGSALRRKKKTDE